MRLSFCAREITPDKGQWVPLTCLGAFSNRLSGHDDVRILVWLKIVISLVRLR